MRRHMSATGSLLQQVNQQLVVVLLVRDVAAEGAAQRAHNAELLSVDEALQHDADGHVYVVVADMLSEVHPSVGLCEQRRRRWGWQ